MRIDFCFGFFSSLVHMAPWQRMSLVHCSWLTFYTGPFIWINNRTVIAHTHTHTYKPHMTHLFHVSTLFVCIIFLALLDYDISSNNSCVSVLYDQQNCQNYKIVKAKKRLPMKPYESRQFFSIWFSPVLWNHQIKIWPIYRTVCHLVQFFLVLLVCCWNVRFFFTKAIFVFCHFQFSSIPFSCFESLKKEIKIDVFLFCYCY